MSAQYMIRVVGRLSDDLLTAFPDLLADEEHIQTLLHGWLPDQSALTSVIDRLDELGVTILNVVRVPDSPKPRPPS